MQLPFDTETMQGLSPATRALIFAAWAHRGQKRRFGGREYIWHPLEVAARLESLGADDVTLAAAFLHDTVEHTDTSVEDIVEHFGRRLGACLVELTNPRIESKDERETYFTSTVPTLSLPALRVRLADRLQNLRESHHAPEEYRRRWIRETRAILRAVPEHRDSDPVIGALTKLLNDLLDSLRKGKEERT